ncbi:alpha/beta hydrolase [Bacillus sp. LL01]|uniref:alpha/beta fold hydrolase n=1 Tax=Bacillus sp. LL01 TaxID=1665556 RepID=UPI00064D11D1|nr:alpha/beta hydrolase [Bacillus sp. LL01]KMJ59861.1 alpha/beta hydrolase [Bacillus sp. LL01]
MNNQEESSSSLNGFHLYHETYGDKNGIPTIIMDAGYGDNSKAWESIYPAISKFTQVFLYDRAGLGRSEKSPNPRTSIFMVEELRELLKNRNIKAPYILVGHSFGGVNMRLYSNLYPQEVVGLVLIDSTPEEYRERFLTTMSEEFQEAYNKQFNYEGNYREFMESLEQLKISNKVLDTPTIVMSAGRKEHYTKESQLLWHRMQEEILRFSTNGQFVNAQNSTHYIQNDEPQLVINTIERLIKSISKSIVSNN